MISNSSTEVSLGSSPINADWILEGNPIARNRVISRSSDSLACTIIWDCTAGKFNWVYDIDETVHILEGSVIVSDGEYRRRSGWCPEASLSFPPERRRTGTLRITSAKSRF